MLTQHYIVVISDTENLDVFHTLYPVIGDLTAHEARRFISQAFVSEHPDHALVSLTALAGELEDVEAEAERLVDDYINSIVEECDHDEE